MKLSELKLKDVNGNEVVIQNSYWITFHNGLGENVENIEVIIPEGNDKLVSSEKIPDRFFDLTDRLLTNTENFITELQSRSIEMDKIKGNARELE